jgi:hypothetical protein
MDEVSTKVIALPFIQRKLFPTIGWGVRFQRYGSDWARNAWERRASASSGGGRMLCDAVVRALLRRRAAASLSCWGCGRNSHQQIRREIGSDVVVQQGGGGAAKP